MSNVAYTDAVRSRTFWAAELAVLQGVSLELQAVNLWRCRVRPVRKRARCCNCWAA